MVTLEQAKEYLESQGITIPDFVLQASRRPGQQYSGVSRCVLSCIDLRLLIQLYLLALMGLGQW